MLLTLYGLLVLCRLQFRVGGHCHVNSHYTLLPFCCNIKGSDINKSIGRATWLQGDTQWVGCKAGCLANSAEA
eukprot:1976098-Ditylum_brightwellii.AAC.1